MIRFDGTDLSHHQDDQGPIDWPTLRASSWICWTKATQGITATDPSFTAHWAAMRKQAFTHRLAYGWLTPNTDPVTQAHHFLDVVGTLVAGEGAMCDAEQSGITADGVRIWCETVEAATRRPASVYTGAYVAGGTIWQNTQLRQSAYGPRAFHLAAYTTEQKALALPGVKAYPWAAWQYSSDGPVPGVVGRCDMNRVDRRDLFDLACGISPAPTPPLPEDDDMAKLASNEEARQMPWGLSAPGTEIFLVGTRKRSVSAEEYQDLYANAPAPRLTNAILDSIPDETVETAVPAIDYDKLAGAIAPLLPHRFDGSITVTAAG